jgi:tripartite-type tricarboxylate transporter receptor subunit TctC
MILRLLVAACFGLGLCHTAAAEPPNFKDKRIEVSVGYISGSANDLTTRLVARHLGRFIPGNPTLVVLNKPGAGGVIQTTYMANQAPTNGLSIGYIGRESAFQQLAQRPGARFDLATFQWIGGLSQKGMVAFIRRDKKINTIEELQAARAPIIFAVRAIGGADFLAGKALEMLGVPIKIVSGYPGSPQMNLAFEQGEFDASALTETALKLRPEWIKPGGLAVQLVEFGTVRVSHVRFGPDLKPLPERAAIYLQINKALGLPFGTFAGPPGMPSEITDVFRKAFAEMAADPQFIDEALKSGVELDAVSGATLKDVFTDFLTVSSEVKKEFGTLVE